MKQFLFSLCLLITISYTTTVSAKQLTAHDARKALQHASAQDAQLLLNLVYWSYMRSECTIATQPVLFDHVKMSWKLWLNATSRRRNPRTALPYPEVTAIDSQLANFAAGTQNFINATYINALTYTAEEQSRITSKAVHKYIEAFRQEARTAIAEDIVAALVDLETTIEAIHTTLETLTSKNKNFIDDGINYLMHGLALQSFAQFDKKYIATSEQFFDALADSQDLYMQVWQQLETTRAAYYKELYQTIYTVMTDLNFPTTSFLCIVDAEGLIAPEQQTDPLPALLI